MRTGVRKSARRSWRSRNSLLVIDWLDSTTMLTLVSMGMRARMMNRRRQTTTTTLMRTTLSQNPSMIRLKLMRMTTMPTTTMLKRISTMARPMQMIMAMMITVEMMATDCVAVRQILWHMNGRLDFAVGRDLSEGAYERTEQAKTMPCVHFELRWKGSFEQTAKLSCLAPGLTPRLLSQRAYQRGPQMPRLLCGNGLSLDRTVDIMV